MDATIFERVQAELQTARREVPPPQKRRALRLKAGIPQRTVGEIVGVTAKAVAMWEAGDRTPRAGTRERERYIDLLEALEELA